LEVSVAVADTNQTFMGGLTFIFLKDGCVEINRTVVPSNHTGEAYTHWTYPDDDNAHTVNVTYGSGTLKYMVEPVTLEAYRDTKLLFRVERDTHKH
jgi:hypothetical protein